MGVPHHVCHPSRMESNNVTATSVVLGVVGAVFNPLLGLLGFTLGSLGENRRIEQARKEFEKTYGFKTFR